MMGKLAVIGRELIGLFIDDGRFALAIALWIVIMAGVVRYAAFSEVYMGLMLFLGLAAIIAWTCLSATAARAKHQKQGHLQKTS